MATLRLVPASGSPIDVANDKTVVGRDAGCDVVINDSSVSRKHARLEQWGPKWAVVDQRSANGTFLDGQRVAESVISPGQELRFGKVAYRVEIAGDESGATVIMTSPLVSDATVVQHVPAGPRPAPPPAAEPPAPPPRPAPRPVAPPPPPPVAYAPSPEPPPSGRGPLFYVGLVFATLVILGIVGVGAVLGPPFWRSRAVVDTVRAQLKEMGQGDLEAAYTRNAAEYRSAHTSEAFATFVARHPGLKANTGSTFSSRTVEGATARLAGTLAHAAGTETVTYDLVQEGGEWKVSALEVDGEEAAAGAPPGADGDGLKVETVAVNKVRQGQTVTVKIDIRATGFDLRPEGNVFRVDLAEDLETFGPGGRRIDELSQADLETYNQTIASATGAAATFNTSLTFSQPDPGRYKAVITIRDKIGQKSGKHEVPFELP